ncbi:MAG: hypothetical protein NTW21_08815 [Verrucomicrobia bacterium]|nr:hypothetical protein [Verrucomicrobiota bacterium]
MGNLLEWRKQAPFDEPKSDRSIVAWFGDLNRLGVAKPDGRGRWHAGCRRPFGGPTCDGWHPTRSCSPSWRW